MHVKNNLEGKSTIPKMSSNFLLITVSGEKFIAIASTMLFAFQFYTV